MKVNGAFGYTLIVFVPPTANKHKIWYEINGGICLQSKLWGHLDLQLAYTHQTHEFQTWLILSHAPQAKLDQMGVVDFHH